MPRPVHRRQSKPFELQLLVIKLPAAHGDLPRQMALPYQDDLSYALDFSGAADFSPFDLLAPPAQQPPDAYPGSAASGQPCCFPTFDAVVGDSSVPGDTARAVDAGLHAMITAYLTPGTECHYLQREEDRGSRTCGPESEISPQQEVSGASKGRKKKKKEVGEGRAGVGGTVKKRAAREEPAAGYIQVRARRGEATDSHSLAERVRREKIRQKMQTLQDLVPGCDKVVGKALLLEEIIYYVQSLQSQVEVLSMKLASAEPAMMPFDLYWEDLAMQQP